VRTKISNFLLMSFILVFAGWLYVFGLDKIPSGFYVDEATVVYNAYSILKTGRDEYGQLFPILFRLLGSYSPPLFIYLTVPLIYFFGLGIAVLRSISVVSALLSVVVFYLLSRKLNLIKTKSALFLITFFYAISPWLIFNARLGYEVTLAYLIFNIGLYFLYLSLEKPKYLLWGIPILSLSVYASHNQKFLVPVLLLFFFIVFWKQIFRKESFSFLALSFFIAFLMQIPNWLILSSPAFWIKKIGLGDQSLNILAVNFLKQILSYYSPRSLFYLMPDIDLQHTLPEISVVYNWMVVPYLLGLYLMFNKFKNQNYQYLILLFFVSVIPASFSGAFISVQRALPFLLPLTLVVGLGLDFLIKKMPKVMSVILFFSLTVYSLICLYRSYFVLFPKERAGAWNYGYGALAEYLSRYPENHFVIDNYRNPRLYIELLFFLKYSPAQYQSEVDPTIRQNYYQAPRRSNDSHFGNIEVREIDWRVDPYQEQVIIDDGLSVSEDQVEEYSLTKVYQLKDFANRIVFNGYKTNPKNKCLQEKRLSKKQSPFCLLIIGSL